MAKADGMKTFGSGSIISFLDHMQLELAVYKKYLEEFKCLYSESGYQDGMMAVMCRLSRAMQSILRNYKSKGDIFEGISQAKEF